MILIIINGQTKLPCSLEYQTINLLPEWNYSSLFNNGNDHQKIYHPRFIRIPRCNGGYCSINRLQQTINNDEWNQSECRPINIQYKTIIQTIKSYDQYKIQKSLEYRKIQIAYHTGCQCYCRQQQQQQCENNRKQFFNDSCQCECRLDLADEQFDCSKRFTRHGHMFWDNDRCECRCPQFYYEYIHHLNPLLSMNNQYYCPNGHYLDQNSCKCFKQKTNNIL